MNALFALALLQETSTTDTSAVPSAAAAGMGIGMMIVWLAVVLLIVISLWKIFVKAGKPGWAAIVPIYNLIVILEIAGKPIWWFILMLIPLVNIIVLILVYIAFARNFGKGVGFAIGMVILPFIFFPMLAFSDARYQPVAA
ncbi:MAG TPA: DUF5684 domain-containing protein [Thermoanaerobaculia bacterium]|jgi:hypothetical protein|nr:DUF5684 domain-containing protein [Thermoanaerobaculia bacterium]